MQVLSRIHVSERDGQVPAEASLRPPVPLQRPCCAQPCEAVEPTVRGVAAPASVYATSGRPEPSSLDPFWGRFIVTASGSRHPALRPNIIRQFTEQLLQSPLELLIDAGEAPF